MSAPRGDKPRKFVFCNPADHSRAQEVVTRDFGFTDVLVKPNPYVREGRVIVCDESALIAPEVVGEVFTMEQVEYGRGQMFAARSLALQRLVFDYKVSGT